MVNREAAIKQLHEWAAETAIILGSGLSSVVHAVQIKSAETSYAEFGKIPKPRVPGHAGRFVLGKIDNRRTIFAQGRVHLYEGFSAREVTALVRVLARAEVKQLVITNAAGAIKPRFKPGQWMMITDHINLTGASPLVGTLRLPRWFRRRADMLSSSI
jgi:purine-nucleoside phosphorylase